MPATVTSAQPLQVDFLPAAALGTPGRFGITGMPGRVGSGYSQKYARDLMRDVLHLKANLKVSTLVSLMLSSEYANNGPSLAESRQAFRRHGVGFEHFPFRESSAPALVAAGRLVSLVQGWITRLEKGESIVIHSRAGQGRANLIAACLLVARGKEPEQAIKIVTESRKVPLDSAVQVKFVHAFKEVWLKATHEMHKTVCQALDAADLTYQAELGDVDVARFGIEADQGAYNVAIATDERLRSAMWSVLALVKVPEQARGKVAELIARINHDLSLAALELDMDTGELRVTASVYLPGSALSTDMVGFYLQGCLHVMDTSLPRVLSVAFAGTAAPVA